MQRSRIGFIVRTGLIAITAIIAAVVALIFLIPAEIYRGPIEQAGEAATGRALHLRGPLGFSRHAANSEGLMSSAAPTKNSIAS
jgi:uncharacterized protein involved in outer membrane biogenesis